MGGVQRKRDRYPGGITSFPAKTGVICVSELLNDAGGVYIIRTFVVEEDLCHKYEFLSGCREISGFFIYICDVLD